MSKEQMIPPACCVVIEMEQGISLGYRKAVLLRTIQALHSLDQAAAAAHIVPDHAREIVLEMNSSFRSPLVDFPGAPQDTDAVALTQDGEMTARRYWQQFEPAWRAIQRERSQHY